MSTRVCAKHLKLVAAHGQVWKQRAAPLLWEHLAASMDSIETYTLFYHEAALTNLLEVCLKHAPLHTPAASALQSLWIWSVE